MNVLVYLNHPEGAANACTMYRNYNPLKYAKGLKIRYRHDVQAEWDVDRAAKKVNSVDLDTSDLEWADVVVFNRFYDNVAIIGAVAGVAKKMGKLVVYETDDFLHAVHHNTGEGEWSDRVKNAMRFINWILVEGAVMTVTTEHLKEQYQRKYPSTTIHALGNYYDPSMWRGLHFYKKMRKRFKKRDKIRIGWQGGNNHLIKNFKYMVPALNRLHKKYGDRFEFVTMGGSNPNIKIFKELQKDHKVLEFPFEHNEAVTINQFPRALAELDLDIGLIVVEDNPFSRCKTNIKWLEYSLLGVPSIASDCVPYRDTNAILVDNTEEEWFNALENLLLDKDKRDRMGAEAREMALKYNAKHHAYEWRDFYSKQLDALRGRSY